MLFFVSSRRGHDTSLNDGINLAQYVAMPRTSDTDFGGLILLWTAFTLAGYEDIPSLEKMKPKNDSDDLLNSHLALFLVSNWHQQTFGK